MARVTLPTLPEIDREAITQPPGSGIETRFARWESLQLAWSRLEEDDQERLCRFAEWLHATRGER